MIFKVILIVSSLFLYGYISIKILMLLKIQNYLSSNNVKIVAAVLTIVLFYLTVFLCKSFFKKLSKKNN